MNSAELTFVEISEGVVLVGIRPKIPRNMVEEIKRGILEYIVVIGRSASAGVVHQEGNASCFEVSTLSPWPEFLKAVEIGAKTAYCFDVT